MIVQTYIHRGCKHEGETVTVRPDVDGNAFYPTPPHCVETGVELEQTTEERES